MRELHERCSPSVARECNLLHRNFGLQLLEPGSNNVTGGALFMGFRELKRMHSTAATEPMSVNRQQPLQLFLPVLHDHEI
jgi:hypothetical protein